ncbi:MAG: hypothetical protein AAFX87_00040 [Bacteroidota bacterium]
MNYSNTLFKSLSGLWIGMLLIIIGCTERESKLNGTWMVIDNYGQSSWLVNPMFTFDNDSICIYYIGTDSTKHQITRLTDFEIAFEGIPDMKYHFRGDSLILGLPEYDLKLLRFEPKVSSIPVDELRSILMRHWWSYDFEGIRLETSFIDSVYIREIRVGETLAFWDDLFSRELEEVYWTLEEYQGQLILAIENDLGAALEPSTFYIQDIAQNGEIHTTAWLAGEPLKVIFKPHNFPRNDELANMQNLIKGKWMLKSVSQHQLLVDSTEWFIDPFKYEFPSFHIGKKGVLIDSTDLVDGGLCYSFQNDGTYEVTKSNGAIACTGKWRLSKNGKVVAVTTDFHIEDEFAIDFKDFLIEHIDNGSIKIQQQVQTFTTDSTYIQDHYDLVFNKLNSNE